MVDPIATPHDVRARLNLPDTTDSVDGVSGISDSDIKTYLEDAAFENQQANNLSRMDDATRKQIEWRLAGIKILSYRKGLRAYHQQSLGSMSRSYETKSIDDLRSELMQLDPSDSLGQKSKPTASISVPEVK